jgi:hypothetical protein
MQDAMASGAYAPLVELLAAPFRATVIRQLPWRAVGVTVSNPRPAGASSMPSASTIVALTETERHGFDIQEGAHKMVDQMRKWFSYDDDAQITHVRKIRLGAFAREWTCSKINSCSGSCSAPHLAICWRYVTIWLGL